MFRILILSSVLSLLPTFGFAGDSKITKTSNVDIVCEDGFDFLAISTVEKRLWIGGSDKYQTGDSGLEARDVRLIDQGPILNVRGELEMSWGEKAIKTIIVTGEIRPNEPTIFITVYFSDGKFTNADPLTMNCRTL